MWIVGPTRHHIQYFFKGQGTIMEAPVASTDLTMTGVVQHWQLSHLMAPFKELADLFLGVFLGRVYVHNHVIKLQFVHLDALCHVVNILCDAMKKVPVAVAILGLIPPLRNGDNVRRVEGSRQK